MTTHQSGQAASARNPGLLADALVDLTDDPDTPPPNVPTASDLGLVSCHACSKLSPREREDSTCLRCGSALSRRKPASLSRTWAFLLAACILYIPANTLPIMLTSSLRDSQQDTILSGIIYLWLTGARMLALIVLVASIIVPLMKIVILTYLLLSVHWRSTRGIRQRTRLYRMIEVIGRWSMLDIFVVALLAALVRDGILATVLPGPGAIAFGAVVVMTMLASLSFDPRLMWDVLEKKDG